MGAKVATAGEVAATPGTVLFQGAKSGTWAAGAIVYKQYPKLTVSGRPAIYEATCVFTFTGDVGGTETVTLTATSKALQGGAQFVLVQGDAKVSAYGNQLRTAPQGKLFAG